MEDTVNMLVDRPDIDINISLSAADTFPKLLYSNCRKWGHKRVAMRKKSNGIWLEYSWQDIYERVKYFTLALLANGFEPGDKVAALGDNTPDLFWVELAALSGRGIMTIISADCLSDEVKYQARHSDAKFIIAEDQEQVDKVVKIESELPLLWKIIYWDPKGLKKYTNPLLVNYADFLKQGELYERSHLGLFERMIAETSPDDDALILYTSGTTGLPKGVVIKNGTIMQWTREALQLVALSPDDNSISFTLPGWVLEQVFSIGSMLFIGVTMNFPEEPETVQSDLREIAPDIVVYPTRLWERLYAEISGRITDSSIVKKMAYNLLIPVGYKFVELARQKRKPNLFYRIVYLFANLLLFRPLKDKHGLISVRYGITSGTTLGQDIVEFFRAIGVNMVPLYAITEAGVVSGQRAEEFSAGTVGLPVGDAKSVRIAMDGEILIDIRHCFEGYYKDGAAYRQATFDSWYHTGDAGYFTEGGHLVFLDRLADMKILANGKTLLPQYIESQLKASPFITDALVVGSEESDTVIGIINLDLGAVLKWVANNKVNDFSDTDLSQKPEVCELIRGEVVRICDKLPENLKIGKFVNVRKEFDPDEGELTRSRKLRRIYLEKRYKELVDDIYRGKEEFKEKVVIEYQDGTKGEVETVIRVNEV